MNSREGSSKRGKRGMGTIRLTRHGNFEYRISYKDEFGRRRIKSFTCPTIEECSERAERFRESLVGVTNGIRHDMTVEEIIRQKIDSDYQKNFCGEQGYSRNLDTLAIIERSGIGNMRIVDVKQAHINLFLKSITKYSNNMIRKIYSMLKAAFRSAYDARIITTNPMAAVDARCPKSNKTDRKVRGFTEEEQSRFLKALEEHVVPYGRNSYKLQFLIELYGGLRMGEINALKPEDIDFDTGVVRVSSTVSVGLERRVYIKEGAKTEAGTREVPINKKLGEVLRQAVNECKDNPEGLLFYDYRRGGIIETTQTNSSFKRICEKAGVENFGQHSLRHTFATRCIEAGVPAVVLKKWMGHTNIHVTLDTYAEVFDRMHDDSVEKFNALMDEMDAGSGE